MDEQALERAKQRIAEARAGRNEEGRFEAALRRSREEVEALGAAALALEAAMPERIGEAVQEGLRREVLPVGAEPRRDQGARSTTRSGGSSGSSRI